MPDQPTAVYGIEQLDVPAVGAGEMPQYADGVSGWLHAWCFSAERYWQTQPPTE